MKLKANNCFTRKNIFLEILNFYNEISGLYVIFLNLALIYKFSQGDLTFYSF